MADEEQEYQKLPGSGMRKTGGFTVASKRSRLWLGKDHLLCVDTQYFVEEYRRYYLRDIQGFIIRRTGTGKTINGLLCIPALVCTLSILSTANGLRTFWLISALVSVFFLVLNVAFGPTCICHIRTPVQTEQLPSLGRLRRAYKVLDRVRPLIVATQGQLSTAEIAQGMGEPLSAPSSASAEGGTALT